jgi:hypothetical protein
MDKEYYLVITNILKKQFIICEAKDDFKNDEYEIYLKFMFTESDNVKIISSIHQYINLPFGIKLMLEFVKNIFSNIIKKEQVFKLKKNINFQEDLYLQLKQNKIISYLDNDEWVDFPKVDSVLSKYKS